MLAIIFAMSDTIVLNDAINESARVTSTLGI
jgi:hypothetical protein